MIELAKEFPNFGYVKEESGNVIARIRTLLASPAIRTVFSARGGFGWLYESRLGTEGLVTERTPYADILAQIWKLMKSGSDPARLKDMYSKLTLMWNLSRTHPGDPPRLQPARIEDARRIPQYALAELRPPAAPRPPSRSSPT